MSWLLQGNILTSFHASGTEPEMLASLALSSNADTQAHEDMVEMVKKHNKEKSCGKKIITCDILKGGNKVE